MEKCVCTEIALVRADIYDYCISIVGTVTLRDENLTKRSAVTIDALIGEPDISMTQMHTELAG